MPGLEGLLRACGGLREFVRTAVNEALGETRIGTSRTRGVLFVAVDDCYPAGGTLVFDARTNAAQRAAERR